jgi:GTP-sensing pleiotropic transcriptional regulator CodY
MEQKLINEYNELCEKLENLQEWLSEDHSDLDLDDNYFQLMRRQAVVMDEYAGILETRMNILGIRY